MRVVNCKTVCREIEEADYDENLTASVMEHLTGCGQCQRFYDERRKLRQLVASLEMVSAPADFDLRVRSRLANQTVDARSGLLFSSFTFGFPSAALATLILVIGGFFAFRVWSGATPDIAVQPETPQSSRPGAQDEQRQSTGSGLKSNAEKQVLATARSDSSEAILQVRQPKKRSQLRSAVASSRNEKRLVTKEFSSTPAPVVKKEEAVASLESSPVFPIETSSQPLRLSLDYSGGVSRTISVPALSFGSERVLTGDGLSLVKNSPKGAW
jgi:hypothetical protein